MLGWNARQKRGREESRVRGPAYNSGNGSAGSGRQRGWSQEGFAHEGGLGRSFAGAIERGEKDIRLSTLTKLARALGVSLSQLLKGIDS